MPPPAIAPSNSLWSSIDTVKDAAESLGIANLPNEVANVIAMDTEYRIFQITEQALKFMRHSKRKTLDTKDINKALKVLNIEPLYGYSNNTNNTANFKQALVGPGQTLYYLDENQLDFEKLINMPLPKIPRLVTFTAHWLAIEGVQPNIPQNPNINDIKTLPFSQRGSLQNLILNSNNINNNSNNNNNKDDDDDNNINPINKKRKFNNHNDNLPTKPLIKHVISKELQLYFNKIIQVLTSSPTNNPNYEYLKNSALVSLKSDPGLHQLIPYFIQFISETITNNLNDISLLHIMLESIYSLLLNENIFLDPYIHALLPCILTLLLAKKIGKLPISINNWEFNNNKELDDILDETLAIREFAASLLDHILKNYGSNYNTLKPRVARTLLKALLQNNIGNNLNNNEENNDKEGAEKIEETIDLKKIYKKNLVKNFGCYYGAIIGINKLGEEIIRLILLGNLKIWSEFVNFKNDNNEEVVNYLITKEKSVLKDTVITSLKKLKVSNSKEINEDKLKQTVGDWMLECLKNEKDYKEIVNGIFFGDV